MIVRVKFQFTDGSVCYTTKLHNTSLQYLGWPVDIQVADGKVSLTVNDYRFEVQPCNDCESVSVHLPKWDENLTGVCFKDTWLFNLRLSDCGILHQDGTATVLPGNTIRNPDKILADDAGPDTPMFLKFVLGGTSLLDLHRFDLLDLSDQHGRIVLHLSV